MTAPSSSAFTESFDGDIETESIHANMAAAGEQIDFSLIQDTWAYNVDEVFELPDGIQKIYFKRMNEGQKADFQKKTNKDIRVQRTTGDAKMSVDPAEERKILILLSVNDWVIYKRVRQGNEYVMAKTKFDKKALEEWMVGTNPKIIQDLEKAIRSKNEWMKVEADIKALEAERENLDQRIQALKDEEASKS